MNVIGIYPGSFQPPTKGNYQAYEYLRKVAGPNTFVATSDKVDLPNLPLNFQDKQQIWTRHGVPIDKVVKTADPQKAQEITKKFGPDRTVAIFGMIKSEADVALKSEYFLLYKGISNATEPLSKHAYILVIPDAVVFVNKSLYPETIRKAFSSQRLTEEQKKSFFKQIFGWYDISLFDLIKKKFAEADVVRERLNETLIFRRFLKPFIKEILGQLTTPQGMSTMTTGIDQGSMDQTDPESAAKLAQDKRNARVEADKQLKQKEKDLKTAKEKLRWQKGDADKMTKFDIPNLNKDIQKLKGAKI